MNEYCGLAAYYDGLNTDFPYAEYARFIEKMSNMYGNGGKRFADCACGTGSLTLEMAQNGYSVTAFDISEEELSVAEKKLRDSGLSARILRADMRDFRAAGTFDVAASVADSVNYLVKSSDVAEFLSSAYDSLEKGGILVFDVNTAYRFENVYSDNAYVLESEEAFLSWQNEYEPKTKKCRFYLSLFVCEKSGLYSRYDEIHTEKLHTEKTLSKLIAESGFELCAVFGGINEEELSAKSEKAYYVLRKQI